MSLPSLMLMLLALLLLSSLPEGCLGLAIRYPRSTGMPQDRERGYSNPRGTSLTQIRENVWLGERSFFPTLPLLTKTDVACKMAVVKLPSGDLWVHSRVAVDRKLKDVLEKIAPVKHIITPNTEHMKYAAEWILAYPDATSYAPPGLLDRKPQVGWDKEIGCDANVLWTSDVPEAWGGVITMCWIDRERLPIIGRQFFSEVVFSHVSSKTLFVTDLWWNYPDTGVDIEDGNDIIVPGNSRLWKKAMDKVYAPIYNNLLQSNDYIERIQEVFDWDWDYIAPCHGEPIEGIDCKPVLAHHLGYGWKNGVLN